MLSILGVEVSRVVLGVQHTVTIWYPPGESAGNEASYELECDICRGGGGPRATGEQDDQLTAAARPLSS